MLSSSKVQAALGHPSHIRLPCLPAASGYACSQSWQPSRHLHALLLMLRYALMHEDAVIGCLKPELLMRNCQQTVQLTATCATSGPLLVLSPVCMWSIAAIFTSSP